MKKKNTKYLIYGITLTLIVAVVGVTYAYWVGIVEGEGSNISVTLDKVNILFTDNTEIAESKARPGWSTSKTFTIENQGTTDYRYDIYIKDLMNTLVTENYLQYKITSNNGFNMTDFEPLPKSSEAINYDLAPGINIPAGVTQEYTIEFRYLDDPDVDQSDDMGTSFSGQLMIEAAKVKNLYDKILADHPIVNTRTDFDNVFGDETATTGVIYKESIYRETPESTGSENNNKDVYYFAGNVRDNWLEFGGYMWRIIRTNEDGSVRLLYHGTSTTATDAYIKDSVTYNESFTNIMYVGYMYGDSGSIVNNRKNTTSAPIKTIIDDWYKNNIFNKGYDGYVSKTAIYCNDRASSSYSNINSMTYAAEERLYSSKNQPTYQCGQNPKGSAFKSSPASVADKFSASTESGGNGQLEYPIAMMTADEISFIGGKYNTNAPKTYYYLNSLGESSTGKKYWWTMSPAHANGTSNVVRMYRVEDAKFGQLDCHDVNYNSAIRPVLSLKSCASWESGDGNPENPYTVSVSETCSTSPN